MHKCNVTDMVARFVFDDTGQDLIEYALLSGFIGVGGLVFFTQLAETMSSAYTDWVTDVHNAWEPCPPGGC